MGRPAKSTEILKRIQMDMPEKSVERLKRVQTLTESTSYAEVLKNALKVYEILLEATDTGGEILIRRGDSIEKLTIFSA